MKRLLFAMLICFLTFPEVNAQPPGSGSFIYIDWGRQSKECRGFGICDMKMNIEKEDVPGLLAGIAFLNPSLINISVKFDRKAYEDNKSNFVDGKTILIEEDYVIRKEVTRALGLPDGHKIKKGKYEIKYDKRSDTYNCTF